MITLVYLVSVLMAHLFKQMYVDEIDLEALTVEKLMTVEKLIVFTEMFIVRFSNWKRKR